jgi:small subunit ribosomal protein S9
MIDPKTQEVVATGRRKTASARVRLNTSGTGKVLVNGRALEVYFPTDSLRTLALRPLAATDSLSKFDVRVNVIGGGPVGQAGAVSLGIARALLENDENTKPALRTEGLLTRDPRMRERKKYGQPGARKRFQFSKR